MAPVHNVNQDLDDQTRERIIQVFGAGGLVPANKLKPYFDHYKNEMKSSLIIIPPPIPPHDPAIEIFNLLKTSAYQPKHTMMSSNDGLTSAALDLGVRIMLGTSCKTPGTYAGDVFMPEWRNGESLIEFVDRVYPRYPIPADEAVRNTVISSARLSADSLKNDSRLTIEWTNRLSDHLILLTEWKKVYIFRYPCYIKMCLEALSKDKPELDQDTASSLAMGALPAALLIETLATYGLLFSNEASRTTLREAIKQDSAFGSAYSTFSLPHNEPRDARSPDTIELLYKKFPHWGGRLEDLWKEIDNPTPATRIEKFSEKRKSPRWTTWWGLLGLLFAILFGIAATVLGAVQVWIPWCSWMDNPSISGRSAKPLNNEGPSPGKRLAR
ncbi:hypothetical protein QBC37DRAFT_295039 [Rhypophila decipiens]|uniref:Uncharacterized protein n=1 Tax=Rhypophila decipiens TaxID=261697 RepID=A0AAN6XYS9_9PEZI|nr:hypothetical protein QBC37DRAFT_295039 [Rhypophila decipiens]